MNKTLEFAKHENWVLSIAERIKEGHRVEDARVELKAEWIDATKAARRLAGHANAARGAAILWVIGLDEATGVVGCQPEETANWLPAVLAHFDGVAPFVLDLVVPVEGKSLVALIVSTERAPFVVKNPTYGKKDGGPVELEVPYREGSKTRTANRSDLLRILVPLASLPEVELLSGAISYSEMYTDETKQHVSGYQVSFWSLAYLGLDQDRQLTIPNHRCTAEVNAIDSDAALAPLIVEMKAPERRDIQRRAMVIESHTMRHSAYELVASGSGTFSIEGRLWLDKKADWLLSVQSLRLTLRLSVVEGAVPLVLTRSARTRLPGSFGGQRRELAGWQFVDE